MNIFKNKKLYQLNNMLLDLNKKYFFYRIFGKKKNKDFSIEKKFKKYIAIIKYNLRYRYGK